MGRPRNELSDVFSYIDMREGDEQQCWPWQGSLAGRNRDRPTFSVGGHKHVAYRLVYELYWGQVPGDMLVRHRCSNSLCCNPHHLELGTVSQNSLDEVNRDRHHNAIPVAIMREIKELGNMPHGIKLTHAEIARHVSAKHGRSIARATVTDILSGRRRASTEQQTAEEYAEAMARGEHVLRRTDDG